MDSGLTGNELDEKRAEAMEKLFFNGAEKTPDSQHYGAGNLMEELVFMRRFVQYGVLRKERLK